MSVEGDEIREADMTVQSFRDPMWLGSFPLNRLSIMDYFSTSIFYDKSCNNEVAKMQRLDPNEVLKEMKGFEYALTKIDNEESPRLFVLKKYNRTSPTEVKVVATYYCLDGTIYQAPDLHHILSSRIREIVHHVQGAFNEVTSRGKYSASHGHHWDFDKKQVERNQKAFGNLSQGEKQKIVFDHQKVENLLKSVHAKFVAPNHEAALAAAGAPLSASNAAPPASATANSSVNDNANAKRELNDPENAPTKRRRVVKKEVSLICMAKNTV